MTKLGILSKKNVDITGGPIVKSIIVYSLPIMLGSLLQVLFNAADLMVLGNMADTMAVASVGATASIVGLLVNSFVGLSAGVSAVLARCIGQGDEARARRVVSTALLSAFFLGIILSVLCISFSDALLRVTDCPDDCIEGAGLYIKVYAVGVPAILVYNFAASIIRTSGDTQRPFFYLLSAGILNVVLNFILCLILPQKVIAVAIATAASQTLACVLALVRLTKSEGVCSISFRSMRFGFRELIGILKIGAPCAFNSALFSLSNLQMQAAINSYDSAAIAGNTAASTIENFSGAISNGFNSAIVPFVGQNVGAGNKKRVKQSLFACASLALCFAAVLSVTLYIFGKPVLSIYVPDSPEAVSFGISRMKFVLLAYPICALYNSFVSAMQAFGYSFVPMLNSIITVLGFRILWLEAIYPRLEVINHTIENVYLCYTISWTLSLIAHTTMFLIIYTRYKKGKVKQF